MNKKTILTMALGGAVLFAGTGCDKVQELFSGKPQQAPQAMHPVPVGTMNLVQQDVTLHETWFGHLRGVQEASLRPEVAGRLVEQVYQDGSMCQKGEVLFRIDPSSYKAAVDMAAASLKAAQAGVLRAQATLDQVTHDVERFQTLVHSGSVSEKNLTDALQGQKEAKAAVAAAEAQVAQAEAALETAQINLDRCTIRAPFTGLASQSTASVGELLSASGQPLTTMSSVDPIRVDFSVPTKQLTEKLSKEVVGEAGSGPAITDFELLLEGDTPYPHAGKVVAVDSEVSKSTGTIYFIGHVPNPNLKLRSGLPVRVRATTGVLKDALLVPARALISSMSHRYIYVVAPDKTPVGIDVKLGDSVTLDMPDGKGGTAPMLMQVVYTENGTLQDKLKELGYADPTDAPVVVEGTQMAEIYAQANRGMKAAGLTQGFGTVVPKPFVYDVPGTTTPSVTAKESK